MFQLPFPIRVIAICVLLLPLMSGDVPFIFSPNTSAKSSEVNANFASLSNRIVPFESLGRPVNQTLVYSAQTGTVGSLISFGGINYRMIAMPAVDTVTSIKYRIVMPWPESSDNFNINLSIGTRTSRPPMLQISGKEAIYSIGQSWLFNGTGSTMIGTMSSSVNLSLSIAVTSNLYADIFLRAPNNVRLNWTSTGYDFTVSAPFSSMTWDMAASVQRFDQLIDYIRIEALP